MCSSKVGTGKRPDMSDFHPCRSRQSLAIAPGQSSWPELRKGTIYLTPEKNASLDNKEPEWSDERLSSKKKKKKKRKKERKEKKVRVPREWSSRQAACIDGWATDLQKSIPTNQAHHLQNRHRNKTLVHLTIFPLLWAHLKKKRKKAAARCSSFELAGTGRAARRCTRSTSVLKLRAELVAKDFGLANGPAFWTFIAMLVSSSATVRAHVYGALCASRSTVTEPFERFTRQLHNFFSGKKNSHWPIEKSKNRQPRRERFLHGTCDRRTQERLMKDERASLFSA